MCRTVKRVSVKRQAFNVNQWIGYTDSSGYRRRSIIRAITNGNVLHLSNGVVISAYSATKRG